MYESEFPIMQFEDLLRDNMQYAGEEGKVKDAQLIYYFLANKYDSFHAKEVLHLTMEVFRKSPRELNELIFKLEDKMKHLKQRNF